MIHSYDTTGQTWDNNKKSASKCPVCDGSGRVHGPAESGTQPTQVCHGCDGKGWVVV